MFLTKFLPVDFEATLYNSVILYIHLPNIFEFGPQRIWDLAFVCHTVILLDWTLKKGVTLILPSSIDRDW